jgi:hypothetical protein
LPNVGVASIGETCSASSEGVTPHSSLLRTHAPIPSGSPLLRPWPRSRSPGRLRSAPAASGMFPTLSLRIFLQMPDPMPRRSHEVHLPVSSFVSSAFPKSRVGRLPASNPRTRFFADRLFEAADIPLCSGLQICSPPRSFPPLRIQPQGGRGFDIRAERASLPPHAPDLLTVRIQAIDGTRTFTSQDSQPCRLLPASCRFSPAH